VKISFRVSSDARVMRLVAGVADNVARVLFGDDLRELSRLGRVRFVTLSAERCHIWEFGNQGGRIFGVFGQRTVTGFAADARVLSGFFDIDYIGVAGLASFPSGVYRSSGCDFGQGSPAIVAVLTEALGDDQASNKDEDD